MRVLPGETPRASSFLRSALTLEGPRGSLDEIRRWFDTTAAGSRISVERIPFSRLERWGFDPATGDLRHASGRFFSIEGISVDATPAHVPHWEQPIINQPEIGILGIITRSFEGIPHFLMQVKMEPGNIRPAQLSPTVQATRSNYTQVHQGKLPLYLEHFIDRAGTRVWVDQLQSEQGARFFRKRNRNMIIEVPGDLPVHPGFTWLTLGQMKTLLAEDDLVNMDARSVLSCIPFIEDVERTDAARLSARDVAPFGVNLDGFGRDVYVSMRDDFNHVNTTDQIISWFTELKSRYRVETKYLPLKEVAGWERTAEEIRHTSGDFFSVVAVAVEAGNREVARWTQPLIRHPGLGLNGYLAWKFDGVLHFLVQARMEPGNFDVVEMAPSVCCSSVDRNKARPGSVPYLDLFLGARPDRIRYKAVQSEEGGRFYQLRNHNMVIEVPPEELEPIPENYIWMTARQINEFTRHFNYFNMDGRGLMACLSFLPG